MKVIARPIGTGKTKELMDTALEADGIILTCNKRALTEKAKAYGFDSLDIVEWNDLMYGNFDENKPLFVHKLDDVMQEYFWHTFGIKMEGYSVTMEE